MVQPLDMPWISSQQWTRYFQTDLRSLEPCSMDIILESYNSTQGLLLEVHFVMHQHYDLMVQGMKLKLHCTILFSWKKDLIVLFAIVGEVQKYPKIFLISYFNKILEILCKPKSIRPKQ